MVATMRLTRREITTIQVALRCWRAQMKEHRNPSLLSDRFIDELPLSVKEIDRLCDRLGKSLLAPKASELTEIRRMNVPTYLASQDPSGPDCGEPHVPILIGDAAGIRLLLGADDWLDDEKPEIQIERRPRGWMILIHPNAGDAVGFFIMLDDGRSFFVHEYGADPHMEQLYEIPRELDHP